MAYFSTAFANLRKRATFWERYIHTNSLQLQISVEMKLRQCFEDKIDKRGICFTDNADAPTNYRCRRPLLSKGHVAFAYQYLCGMLKMWCRNDKIVWYTKIVLLQYEETAERRP